MAGVVDRLRKRNRQQQQGQGGRDWTNTGSFISKPARGWLHPDEQLAPDAGVCYGVRYVGCMEVKESMKSLDFDTRTAVAKESISRVCDAAGLKTATKKSKRGAKISRLLGDEPQMVFAGSNVNLTITTENLTIMNIENGDIIGIHQMPCISFASGGDPDTLDFVAYVAKDENGRLCHVLECGGGLAQDVITTIGQAFELRFKQYLAKKPQPVNIPNRTDSRQGCGDQWGEDQDYYNDRVGAQPPEPEAPDANNAPQQYAAPRSNLPVSDGIYSSVKNPASKEVNLIDFDADVAAAQTYDNSQRDLYDNTVKGSDPFSDARGAGITYDNPLAQGAVGGGAGAYDNQQQQDIAGFEAKFEAGGGVYDNRSGAGASAQQNGSLDAFDMKPFCNTLPGKTQPPTGASGPNPGQAAGNKQNIFPYQEQWFHGRIGRDKCEQLLLHDGDFLVRESPNTPGQFVLSGRHGGRIKHLLLVDPEGVVRTKDRTFNSVTHLVNYHMENSLPITSTDSELFLKTPVLQPLS